MVRARLLVPFAAICLAVSACGGDDDAADSVPATDPAAATTDAEPAPATDAPETVPATDAPEPTTPATDAPDTTTAGTEAPETTVASIGSIIDMATTDGRFGVLLSAIDAAGLTEQLSGGEFTLLAPTDDAFAALGQPAVDALLADPDALTALLENHVLPGTWTAERLSKYTNVLTLGGGSLDIVLDGGAPRVGGADIVTPDLLADNGVVQTIDAVLVLPPA